MSRFRFTRSAEVEREWAWPFFFGAFVLLAGIAEPVVCAPASGEAAPPQGGLRIRSSAGAVRVGPIARPYSKVEAQAT